MVLLLRLLDGELKLHTKAMDSEFEAEKLSFVMEAKGMVQEEAVVKAQSRIASAFHASMVAAHKLFVRNLEGDQIEHRRRLATASTESERSRTATIAALQAGLCKPFSVSAYELSNFAVVKIGGLYPKKSNKFKSS